MDLITLMLFGRTEESNIDNTNVTVRHNKVKQGYNNLHRFGGRQTALSHITLTKSSQNRKKSNKTTPTLSVFAAYWYHLQPFKMPAELPKYDFPENIQAAMLGL